MDKTVLQDISYGMYIVSSKASKNVGCVINTLTQVTSENPIISICLNKDNYTNQVIKKSKKFAISILSEKCDPNIISQFGFQTSENVDKFQNTVYQEISGLPVLTENMCAYIICELIDVIDAESHDVFMGRVIDLKKLNNINPMTYKYYHEVIKGKAPKKAPTYIEDKKESNEEQWVCSICGYVHKGPIPEDFVCPICGVDASNFQKIN